MTGKKKCSFCGRDENEVTLLISGLNGYICDSCASQVQEIVKDALQQKKTQSNKKSLAKLPKPREIKEFLDEHAGEPNDVMAAGIIDMMLAPKKKEETPEPTTKECPFCHETISIKATKCPHCTSDLAE